MAPTIEFDCGEVSKPVGNIAMACKAHIGKCTNESCQAEVTAEAKKAGIL